MGDSNYFEHNRYLPFRKTFETNAIELIRKLNGLPFWLKLPRARLIENKFIILDVGREF